MTSSVVTGGAGFVGSNLCRHLLMQGERVFAVDNLITGHRENVEEMLRHPNFSFHQLDVTSPAFVGLFADEPVNYIYHLACPTGVPNIARFGREMLSACSLGTFNVIAVAQRHRARILYTSSAEAYGDPEKFPQEESYSGNVDPTGPRCAYEEGKRFSEACLAAHVREGLVDAIIVRIFNTYGPGMSLEDTRVVPQFLRSILEDRPLLIYGDGTQKRSHQYIDDLLRGFSTVMHRGKAGEVYNIGSSRPITIRELAEMLIEKTGHAQGIEYRPHFIADHGGRHPSTAKAEALGWRAQVTLEEGLERMIAAYLPKRAPAAAPAAAPAPIAAEVPAAG